MATDRISDEQIDAVGAQFYGTCYTPADRAFAKAVLALQPEAAMSDEHICAWWASENGLEDHDMCKLNDFREVVRAVEAKQDAIRRLGEEAGRGKPDEIGEGGVSMSMFATKAAYDAHIAWYRKPNIDDEPSHG